MDLESQIVSQLVEGWKPELILLGGSRALNHHTSTSDWDLYLIGDYSSRESFPEQFMEEHLDIQVRPRSDVPNQVLKIFYGPVPSLRVLKETIDGLGAKIVQATRLAYEAGPGEKSKHELNLDRCEMARMLSKIVSYCSDPEVCFTSFGFFHRLALQLWFETRRRWSLPAHKGISIVRTEDAAFAAHLAIIAGSFAMEQKIQACKQIQSLLWGQ